MKLWPWRRKQEPVPEPVYPSCVRTEADRHRWDLASQAAANVVAEIGGDEVTVLLATRSLYRSDIPTN